MQRLAGYGLGVSADEVFTATLAGAQMAKQAGYQVVAPFVPEPALADMAGLELRGGTGDRSGTGVKGPVQIQQEGFGLGQGIFPG